MSAASDKAAFPEPYQILGLRLLPLSLGRYRLMRRFNVGFASDEFQEFHPSDLILGLLICSQRVDEFLWWMQSKDFSREVRRWSRRLDPWPLLGQLKGRVGKWYRGKFSFNLVEKVALFKRYIVEARTMPRHWEPSGEGESSTSGSHWSDSLEVVLRSECGWTEQEINERPLAKAIADYFALAESRGHIQLMTKEEIEMGEANAMVMEAMEGQKGVNN